MFEKTMTVDNCISIEQCEVALIAFFVSIKSDEAILLARALSKQWLNSCIPAQ
jgi:hypothetical protein